MICGSLETPLWLTGSKEAVCIVQQTFTRKRKARISESEAAVPSKDTSGMSNLSSGHFAVAGPNVALLVTNLLPDVDLPPHVKVVFLAKGRTSDAKRNLLQHPPQPPFVVIAFDMKAGYPTEVTIDHSHIIINGSSRIVLNRPYIMRQISILERVGLTQFEELIALRTRLIGLQNNSAGLEQHKLDQEAYLRIRTTNLLSPAEFRSLPSPAAAEISFLRQIMKQS
jgi:hypothetical protein